MNLFQDILIEKDDNIEQGKKENKLDPIHPTNAKKEENIVCNWN